MLDKKPFDMYEDKGRDSPMIKHLEQLVLQVKNSHRFMNGLKKIDADDICYMNNMPTDICKKLISIIKTYD